MNDQPRQEYPPDQSSQKETPLDPLQPSPLRPPPPKPPVNATRAGSSGSGVSQRNTPPPPPPPPKPAPYYYYSPDQGQGQSSQSAQARPDRYEQPTEPYSPSPQAQKVPADQREQTARYTSSYSSRHGDRLDDAVAIPAKRSMPAWVWIVPIIVGLLVGGGLLSLALSGGGGKNANNLVAGTQGTSTPGLAGGIRGTIPAPAATAAAPRAGVPILPTSAPTAEPTNAPTEIPTEIPTEPPPPPTATCCEVDVEATEAAIAAKTQTAEAKETKTAEAKETKTAIAAKTKAAIAAKTETAIAAKTQTAEAKETKTAIADQNSEVVGRALYASTIRIFGPASVELQHDPSDHLIEQERAGVSLRDFVVQAAFLNPYSTTRGTWDYGFTFRDTSDTEFRLIVTGEEHWYLRVGLKASQSGTLSNLDTSLGGGNSLVFIAKGGRGYFFVNDLFIDTLDLSEKMDAGDVAVGTGFFAGAEIDGESTSVRGFSVGQLP